MKFYQKRGFALVVLILAIIGSGVYGISKKPAALPEVSYYNWICDEAGLLDQETRQTIQDYNTAWNKQYYAVVAVAAVDDIRGWSSEDYARELGARWGLGANDMLLLLVKGGDWYVACGDDLADQMTDTQQTRLKTALDTPYYAGDYSQAAVDFFRQSDVVLAQTLGRSSTGGQSPAPGQRWQEPAGASGVSIAGVVLLFIGLLGSPFMLRLLNTKDDLLPGAILYLRVYFLGMPALALYNFGNAVFSSIGDTKKPLIYLSLAGALNIVLNLFFVIVCRLSVVGVALASAISQCVSAALILRALTRAQDCYALDVHQLHLDPATTKSILALGVPAGFQNAIFAIANLFIQAGVNSFDSLMVKGNSAAANADNMIYDCMAAFYMACASFMSQNYGAGKPDRVKKSYFISLGYSFGVGLALGSALFFFGRTFLALFTTESAVIDAGMKRVAVMAFAYCISAFMDCTIAASRGLGKTVVPTIIVVMGSCVFRVIWVYTIFAHFHTIPALYLLYPCSWTLTAFAEILYFVHCYKQSMALFKEPQAA